MAVKVPDNLDDEEKIRLEEEKAALLAFLDKLENHPDDYIAERITSISKSLTKIHDHPVHKGNISMFQHLTNIKGELLSEPDPIVQAEVVRVRDSLDRINARGILDGIS